MTFQWKKVAINVLRSLNQYLNLSELSDDVQVQVVELFEQLEEDNRMPTAITEVAEMLGLDISDVVAVLVARMLAIMEAALEGIEYIDIEPEPEVVEPKVAEDTEYKY